MVAMFVTRPRPKKDAMTAPPRKKRKADHALDEINFDDTARADYLTGFHKRKVQRQKQAQEIAAEKARIERIQIRKEVREQRSKDVQDHVKAVNDALRAARLAGGEEVTDDEDEDEWKGLDESPAKEAKPEFVDHEEEYIDEDKYTTVTVEAVDVDREGMHALSGRHTSDSEDSSDEESDGEGGTKPKKKKFKKGKDGKAPDTDDKDAKKSKDKKEWPKKKKKKFRYENKLERQISKLNKKARQSKRQ